MVNRPDSAFYWEDASPISNETTTPVDQQPKDPLKTHLVIPEQPAYQTTGESPIDRFGPRLRRFPTTSTTRRSSLTQFHQAESTQCYSPIDGNAASFRSFVVAEVPNNYSNFHAHDDYDDVNLGVSQLGAVVEDDWDGRISEQRTQLEQQQQLENKNQFNLFKTAPLTPRHSYHDSMSSQGTVDKTTVVSREKYCSIDTKTDERLKEYYNSTWKIYLVVIALALTTFCTSLDSTILATAIPQITDRFNSLDDVEWYGAAYLLANCSVQLIYGKLYHLHSVKWVYLAALFLFQLGSFVCAIAPSSVVLITGRAVAGLGAAGILSGSILMIRQLVPLHQRPGYMAALASMTGIAWIIGPIIGGAFTDSVSWRWCFYINLPFGLITCILLLIFYQPLQLLPNSQRVSLRDSVRFLDIEGTALFLPAIVSLLLALQWGGTKYPWGSVQVIVLLIIFSITSVGFVFVQIWKQELATVPPRVMTSRNVWAGFVFTFCFGAAVVVAMYYIPLWLQVIKNDSSESSGIMTLSLVIAMVVTSLVTAILVTFIGYYTPFMILASILMSVGGGLLSTLDTNASSTKYIAFQIIFGIGVGCGIQQSMVAIQAAVNGSGSRNSSSSSSSGSNGSAVSMGTAIMTFAQTLGGAVFIAVAQNVFENKLSNGIVAAKVPGLDPQAILKIGATELRNMVESQYWNAVSHAYNAAIDDTFRVATIVAAVSILGALGMEWISIKR